MSICSSCSSQVLTNVLAQVVDLVVVFDAAVRPDLVPCAQTVLHHHQGDPVAVINLAEGIK